MRPSQRRRNPTKRSSDGQVAEKRQKTADGQAKRIEPRRGESSHAAPNHVVGHDGSQRNTASASNSDANALAGDAAADSMARDVIPERQDGDLRQNAQVPESTRQFDLAGSNPPCEGMVYQRTDNRPSSAAGDYQSIGLSFPGPGPSHMSTDNNQYSCWFGNKDRGPIWGKASPKEIVDLYDSWAEHGYDEMSCEAPRIAATQVASLYEPSRRSGITIIDVGAGTGLVGEKLHEFGFRKIDALDPSSGMLNVAREKQVYRHLICNYIRKDTLTDLNGQYDCLTAAGCVIPGHIEADGLHDFIRLVKKGGYVIITMRGHWPDIPDFFENFQKAMRTLVEDRKCQLVNRTVIENYSCIIPNSTGYKFVLKVL